MNGRHEFNARCPWCGTKHEVHSGLDDTPGPEDVVHSVNVMRTVTDRLVLFPSDALEQSGTLVMTLALFDDESVGMDWGIHTRVRDPHTLEVLRP